MIFHHCFSFGMFLEKFSSYTSCFIIFHRLSVHFLNDFHQSPIVLIIFHHVASCFMLLLFHQFSSFFLGFSSSSIIFHGFSPISWIFIIFHHIWLGMLQSTGFCYVFSLEAIIFFLDAGFIFKMSVHLFSYAKTGHSAFWALRNS